MARGAPCSMSTYINNLGPMNQMYLSMIEKKSCHTEFL